MARREKKPVHTVQMTDGKRAIIKGLLEEYDIETTEDIQNALKDLLGGTIKEMMEAEMDHHLGYGKSERNGVYDEDRDYRNGYKNKHIQSSFGDMDDIVNISWQFTLKHFGTYATDFFASVS